MAIEPLVSGSMFEQMRFNDCRAELWRGSIGRRPFHGALNGILAGEIGGLLGDWAKREQAGAVSAGVGWWIEREPDTVLSPPIAFVSLERGKGLGSGFPKIAPDLAVEIVTHDLSDGWLGSKRQALFGCGTRLFWLLDAEARTVEV